MTGSPPGPHPAAMPARPGKPGWWKLALGVATLVLLGMAGWLLLRPGRACQPGLTSAPAEHAVLEIPLQGRLANSDAELSGLAWYSDTLILLPQYPQRMGTGLASTQSKDAAGSALFALPRAQIVAAARQPAPTPLMPSPVQFDSAGVESHITGFEGYEAIAFWGDRAYLTIEAHRGEHMLGYIVSGKMQAQALHLDPASLTENPPQADQANHSDEALLVTPERILTFFESNGVGLNPAPHATVFDLQLKRLQPLSLPHLEYRLTDAAGPDDQGRFWVINYQYPGDKDLVPAQDPLAAEYGQGATHACSQIVERLVEFQITPQGIVRTSTPPVQLQLRPDGEARNWEGLAILPGVGFILVTDKFPDTILGVVSYP